MTYFHSYEFLCKNGKFYDKSIQLCFINSHVLFPEKICPVILLHLLAIEHALFSNVLDTFPVEKPILLSYDKVNCPTAGGVELPKVDKTHNIHLINLKEAIDRNTKDMNSYMEVV